MSLRPGGRNRNRTAGDSAGWGDLAAVNHRGDPSGCGGGSDSWPVDRIDSEPYLVAIVANDQCVRRQFCRMAVVLMGYQRHPRADLQTRQGAGRNGYTHAAVRQDLDEAKVAQVSPSGYGPGNE